MFASRSHLFEMSQTHWQPRFVNVIVFPAGHCPEQEHLKKERRKKRRKKKKKKKIKNEFCKEREEDEGQKKNTISAYLHVSGS